MLPKTTRATTASYCDRELEDRGTRGDYWLAHQRDINTAQQACKIQDIRRCSAVDSAIRPANFISGRRLLAAIVQRSLVSPERLIGHRVSPFRSPA